MTRSRRYPCARCGAHLVAERLQFSRHSRRYYCLDVAACERRKAKLERQGATFERGFLVGS